MQCAALPLVPQHCIGPAVERERERGREEGGGLRGGGRKTKVGKETRWLGFSFGKAHARQGEAFVKEHVSPPSLINPSLLPHSTLLPGTCGEGEE